MLGWFDGEGSSRFVYPEATGYYLTFLSFLHAQGWQAGGIGRRARQAAGWLGRCYGGPQPPATRVYVCQPEANDWRNRFTFSFDLAMIWRGIAMARRLADAACSKRLQTAMERHLVCFCAPDGGLRASLPLQPGPVAESWSAHPGPFQLKSAAALLCSGGDPPGELRRHAEATFENFRDWTPIHCEREYLHPCLYYVEGALLAGAARGDRALLRQAAAALERAAASIFPHDDWAPASLRSDVLAQVLRSGCLLETAGHLPRETWNLLLPRMAAALCGYCDPDGRMYFQRDDTGHMRHVNVWSGLFAAQALIWYSHWRQGSLPPDSANWLV